MTSETRARLLQNIARAQRHELRNPPHEIAIDRFCVALCAFALMGALWRGRASIEHQVACSLSGAALLTALLWFPKLSSAPASRVAVFAIAGCLSTWLFIEVPIWPTERLANGYLLESALWACLALPILAFLCAKGSAIPRSLSHRSTLAVVVFALFFIGVLQVRSYQYENLVAPSLVTKLEQLEITEVEFVETVRSVTPAPLVLVPKLLELSNSPNPQLRRTVIGVLNHLENPSNAVRARLEQHAAELWKPRAAGRPKTWR